MKLEGARKKKFNSKKETRNTRKQTKWTKREKTTDIKNWNSINKTELNKIIESKVKKKN